MLVLDILPTCRYVYFVSLLAYRAKRNNKTPQAGYVELSRHDIPIHYLVERSREYVLFDFLPPFFFFFCFVPLVLGTATTSSSPLSSRSQRRRQCRGPTFLHSPRQIRRTYAYIRSYTRARARVLYTHIQEYVRAIERCFPIVSPSLRLYFLRFFSCRIKRGYYFVRSLNQSLVKSRGLRHVDDRNCLSNYILFHVGWGRCYASTISLYLSLSLSSLFFVFLLRFSVSSTFRY